MTLFQWLQSILYFINYTVVPFILALAFLFFIWNAFRFFILGGSSEDGREKARRLMLWGIIAFVLILSTWAIVGILTRTFGIHSDRALTPDYIGGGNSGYNGTSPQSQYSCTDLIFGFTWCSEGETRFEHTPGAPNDVIDPNPPPKTTTFTFP